MIGISFDTNNLMFSPGGLPMVSNDWEFNPAPEYILHHIPGSAEPSNLVIDTKIKSYLTAEPNEVQQQHTFEKYFVKVRVDNPVHNGSVLNLYQLKGEIAEETDPDGYDIEDGLEVETELEYQPFALLVPGDYQSRIVFSVWGKTASDTMVLVEEITLSHTIKILEVGEIALTQNQDNFFLNRFEALPAPRTSTISVDGDFSLTAPAYMDITGGNLTLVDETDGVRTYSGSGSQSINYSLNSSAVDLPDGSNQALIHIVTNTWSNTILVDILVGNEPINFIVTPESLEWTVIEGNPSNPDAVQCWYAGNNTVTVTASPPWLSYSIQHLGALWLIEFNVVNTGSLQPGIYEDVVLVKCATITKTVSVKLNYSKKVNLNLYANQIHFTDDFSTISTFHNSNNYDVGLGLQIRTYDFNQVERADLLNLRFGIFRNYAEFFVGKSIKKLMAKLMHPSYVGQNYLPKTYIALPQSGIFSHSYYKPAKVRVSATFINRNTNNPVIVSHTVDNIFFVKGRKPADWRGTWGLLHYSSDPIRVTTQSLMFFNYYSKDTVKLSIYRNSVLETTHFFTPPTGRFLHTSIIPFTGYTPGDVIEVQAESFGIVITNDTPPSRKYIVFPPGKESYHIAWVNEHEMLETMEFTGAFTYEGELEHRLVKTYTSFLEQTEKTEVKKGQKITCNTGFILQTDTHKIEEILDSKRAFLLFPQTTKRQPIHLIPVDKTLKNYDSDQNLYEYELVFQINLPNDNQIYPR
jgi:hypothetical protein